MSESTITINDRPHRLASGATVSALLRELELAERRGVAVAVNGSVVARADWASRPLATDDRVLVIQATQGG